jgi:hypothetical protein
MTTTLTNAILDLDEKGRLLNPVLKAKPRRPVATASGAMSR